MHILKLSFIKRSVRDFISFLKSPIVTRDADYSNTQKIAASIVLLFLKFAFSIAIASLIGLFYEPKNITDQSLSERFTPLAYLVLAGIILPFYEETLFRLSLSYKRVYLALSVSCLGYYLCTKLIYGIRLTTFDESLWIRLGASILLGVVYFLLLLQKRYSDYFQKIWATKFTVIYYLSAVLFAALHIFNFEMTLTNLLLIPILTLPQLFSGLVMGYMRVRFGFIYPLLLHMITNTVFVSLDILVH